MHVFVFFHLKVREGKEGKRKRERESLLVVPETSVTATLRAGPSQGQKP